MRSILTTFIIHTLPAMPVNMASFAATPTISTSIRKKSNTMIRSNTLALIVFPNLNLLLTKTTMTRTIGNIFMLIFSIHDIMILQSDITIHVHIKIHT